MLAFYLAIYTCEGSIYYTYNTTYHTIILDDYNPDYLSGSDRSKSIAGSYPGQYVKHPAEFYPGLNMISINEYRFSLN